MERYILPELSSVSFACLVDMTKLLLSVAEQDETKRLSGDLKALIDTLRAKHNEV